MFSLTILLLHIYCNTQPNLDLPSYNIILNLYHFLYHQRAVLLWKLLILTSFCSCVQWDNAALGGGRPRMRRRPGRRKMVARGRQGGGGGRRGEQTFSRSHIFSRSLDFCASTIFTKIKHFVHHYLHKEQTFFASTFLQGFSRTYIFTRIYNFSCIYIFTRSKDFYSQGAKKEPFW